MRAFSQIKAFAFDVDGVFTDGGILCDTQGELYRTFNAKDGFAVRMAVMHGYPVGIITGGRSVSILERFKSSGVPEGDVYLGARKKSEQVEDFCSRHSLSPADVLFVGDDLPDIPALMMCGAAVCPSDAAPEVMEVCDLVTESPGGRGCIREVIEKVMKAQETWILDTELYKKLF